MMGSMYKTALLGSALAAAGKGVGKAMIGPMGREALFWAGVGGLTNSQNPLAGVVSGGLGSITASGASGIGIKKFVPNMLVNFKAQNIINKGLGLHG